MLLNNRSRLAFDLHRAPGGRRRRSPFGALIGCYDDMSSTVNGEDRLATAAPNEAVDVLLCFGASMLRAGNTAARTREWFE